MTALGIASRHETFTGAALAGREGNTSARSCADPRAVAGYLDGCPSLLKVLSNNEAVELMKRCEVGIFYHATHDRGEVMPLLADG
jgi:hypothetical protein